MEFFSLVLVEMLTHSNFRKLQFHMQLKRLLDYYMPFDRKFYGLQIEIKLRG